jgi:hypothetical protein
MILRALTCRFPPTGRGTSFRKLAVFAPKQQPSPSIVGPEEVNGKHLKDGTGGVVDGFWENERWSGNSLLISASGSAVTFADDGPLSPIS